jgi:hypothetical protein
MVWVRAKVIMSIGWFIFFGYVGEASITAYIVFLATAPYFSPDSLLPTPSSPLSTPLSFPLTFKHIT